MWTSRGAPKLERPTAALKPKPATMIAAMAQAMVKKKRASPRSVSAEKGIVAMESPPAESVSADTKAVAAPQRSAARDGLPVEANVDGDFAEAGDLERDGEVLTDRVL